MSTNENEPAEDKKESGRANWVFWIISAGLILAFVGALIMVLAMVLSGSGSTSGGGVIFIGPFPIVFGFGPDAGWLIAVGIIIAVVSLVLLWVMRRKLGEDG